jgi:sensor histidine kinase regulating citrate/malate metabolism
VHNNYNNKIEIEFTLSEHVLAINTEMLLTAISNVIDNAIYVSEDTKPKLTMFVDQELTISVADSGDGIPAHKIETIFEPTVSSKVGGLGIGMHVLHKIVAKQDGRVTINKLNKGTMVNIILPLKRDDRI